MLVGIFIFSTAQGPVFRLRMWDTNNSNYAEFIWNENDSSNRTINISLNSANRAISLSADLTLSSAGAALIDDADAAAQRTTMGVAIGTNVQAYDADLTTYAGITPSADIQTFLGSSTYATARANLGLGTNSTPLFEELRLNDSNSSHYVAIYYSGDETSDRYLALNLNGANRTLNVTGESTVNQDVSTTGDPTFDDVTANTVVANKTITFVEEYNIGSVSSNFTWNLNNGQDQRVTITGANLQITFTPPTIGVGHFTLRIIQGDGDDTIDWDNCIPEPKWQNGGVNPTLSTTAGYVDILSVYWNGTSYYGTVGPDWR